MLADTSQMTIKIEICIECQTHKLATRVLILALSYSRILGKTLSRLYMSTLMPLKKIEFCREGCLFFCINSYRNFSKRQRTSNELKLRIHYISLGLPGSHFILYFLSIIRVPSAFSLSLLVSNSAACPNDLHMADKIASYFF